jgi:hypothetical protein
VVFQQAHSKYKGAAAGRPLIFLMSLLENHISMVSDTFDGLCGKGGFPAGTLILGAWTKIFGLTDFPSTSGCDSGRRPLGSGPKGTPASVRARIGSNRAISPAAAAAGSVSRRTCRGRHWPCPARPKHMSFSQRPVSSSAPHARGELQLATPRPPSQCQPG